MKISRRDFVHAGCTVVPATLALSIVDKAEAFWHGSAITVNNPNRVTQNLILAPINLSKSFQFNVDPTNQSSDGFPLTTPTSAWGSNPSMPAYFGTFFWGWTGKGSMQIVNAPPFIVSNGGAAITEAPFSNTNNSGDSAGGNTTLLSQTAPAVTFLFGINIQSITDSGVSNGSGGTCILITAKTNFAANLGSGETFNIAGITTQTNANGTWLITKVNSSSFYLQNSTYSSAQGPGGIAGQAVLQASNLDIVFLNSGTYGTGATQMSNLIWCRSADLIAIQNGQLVDQEYVNELRYLCNPSGVANADCWLRDMDVNGTQANFESDFTQRVPKTYVNWPQSSGRYVPGYWTGAITWGTGDAYTCSAPSAWPGLIDGAVVQGTVDFSNRGATPTLNVGGTGAQPIINLTIQPISFVFWGSLPTAGGQTISLQFQASWLNSGTPYTFNYTTQTAGPHGNDTTNFRNLYNNIAAAIPADTTLAAAKIFFSENGITAVNFAIPRCAQAGVLTITYASGPTGLNCTIGTLQPLNLSGNKCTTLLSGTIVTGDVLTFTFTRVDLSGGALALPYTVLSTDTTLQILSASITAAINANATLAAAGITASQLSDVPNTFHINQGTTGTTPNNGQQWDSYGTLTMSLSKTGTGTEAATFYVANARSTFMYSKLLGGYLYRPGGFLQSAPMEYLADVCNRVGANLWHCWGTNSASYVTAHTNFFAANSGNLNAGLKYGTETGNEVWNSGAAGPYGQWTALGSSLGFTFGGGPQAIYDYTSLRTIQYAALSKAAWIAGGGTFGIGGTLYIFSMSAEFESNIGSNFDQYQLQSFDLNPSTNTILGTYGALGVGVVSTNYSASPNRAVDTTTAIGLAPYWASPWMSESASSISGVIGSPNNNSVWLQAALDFCNGSTSTAFTSMANQFNGTTTRPSGGAGGISLPSYAANVFTTQNAQAAQYDSGRAALGLSPIAIMHYEAGPQWGIGASSINGVNSVNNLASSVASGDISALASQMTALGWNVSAFTLSGTNNTTEMATMVLQMTQGWKFDFDVNGNPANTGSYKNMIKTSYYAALVSSVTGGREVKPAQYGFVASQWCYWPVSFGAATRYANYDAAHEFNQ